MPHGDRLAARGIYVSRKTNTVIATGKPPVLLTPSAISGRVLGCRQVCELRLVRCPFQCGVRVLVRNLAKHKKTCALRHGSSDEDDDPQDSGSESPRLLSVRSSRVNDVGSAHRTARAGVGNASYLSPNERRSLPPPPSRPSDRARMGDPMQKGRLLDGDESPADMADLDRSGESPRMVTCMRCHESVPFYLVPSHGANCKGSGPDEGPADFERGLLPPGPPPFSRDPSSSCFSSSSLHVKTKTTGRPSAGTPSSLRAHPSPLMTPRLQNEEMDMFGTSFSSPHDPLIRSRAFSERGDFPACLSAISTTGASPFDTRTAGFKSAGESMISDGDIGAMDIHRSSGGSQRVRFWSTSQVTSWLRMSLGPGPAASRVISRFEEAGIDGASLLELTERCESRNPDVVMRHSIRTFRSLCFVWFCFYSVLFRFISFCFILFGFVFPSIPGIEWRALPFLSNRS